MATYHNDKLRQMTDHELQMIVYRGYLTNQELFKEQAELADQELTRRGILERLT